jgi:hypothetical protein
MIKKIFSLLSAALFVSVCSTSYLLCELQELDGKDYRALRSPMLSIVNFSNQDFSTVTFEGNGCSIDIPAVPERSFLANYFHPLNKYDFAVKIEFSAVIPDPVKKGIHQFATITTQLRTYTLVFDMHTNTLSLYDGNNAFVSSVLVMEGIAEELESYKVPYLDFQKNCVYRYKNTYHIEVGADGTVKLSLIGSRNGMLLIEFKEDTRINFN